MDEFGGALPDHLTPQNARRTALAQERQEADGLARNVGTRHFTEIRPPDDQIDLFRSSLALRHADAGDLRNRVHAARDEAGDGGRRQP